MPWGFIAAAAIGSQLGGNRGGGGQPSQSTVTQTNIPEYARPYVETMLGATQEQLFNVDKNTGQVTGLKGTYVPFGVNPATGAAYSPEEMAGNMQVAQQAIAGFSPMQRQVQAEAAGMGTSPLFGRAAGLAGTAGMGGLGTAQTGLGYGGAGYGSGILGQQLGTQGGAYYGGLGAGYGGAAAGLSPEAMGYGATGMRYGAAGAGMAPAAQMYGQTAADIGQLGLRAERLGRDVGAEARAFGRQAAGAGAQYAQQATSPGAMQAYMSPYMQNVVDVQKQRAIRDYQEQMPQLQAAATRAGAFGGTRDAVTRAMAQRSLNEQLQNIQAQGTQQAFQQAQQAQQFGAGLGLQGLQGAQQGLGTALQGGQLGLGGIGQAMAGQQAGLQGLGQAGQLYGMGMQGAGMGLQGLGQAGQLLGLGMQGAQTGLQGVQSQLAGTAQGMQGAGMGLQGVGAAQAGLGLAGQQAANLANIGGQQQQADLSRLGFQNQMGTLQQQQQQNVINQAIQNYAMQQQYPQQQLAFMNAMLRGLPLQTASTQTYQAPISPLGFLTGMAGTAAGSYMARTGNMPFKKGGIVDSYAGGGDVELKPVQSEIEEQVMYHPEQYSADQIKQSIQNGIVSQLIGIPILQHKEALAKQMAMAQAMNKSLPQQPINREVLAQAGQGGQGVMAPMGAGIDQAPIPQDMFNAAGGGIVAFADNEDQPVRADMPSSEPTSPFGRWLSQFVPMGAERERGQYIGKLAQDVGLQGSIPGFFMSQTDEEKAAAQKMDKFLAENRSKLMKDPAEFAKFKSDPWAYSGIAKPEKITPGTATSFAADKVSPVAVPKDETKTPPAAKPTPKVEARPSQQLDLSPKETKKAAAAEDKFEKALLDALGATTPSEKEETKAIGRAIMRGSAQMFGARRGQEGEKLAKGFEEGIGSYDKYLENLAKDKKELSRVYAEYGLGKSRVAAQERETDVRERIGMAEVGARDRATAEAAATRKWQTAVSNLEKLRDSYNQKFALVPQYLDADNRPTNDRSKAKSYNPQWRSFDQYVQESGLGSLLTDAGMSPQQTKIQGERAPLNQLITPKR